MTKYKTKLLHDDLKIVKERKTEDGSFMKTTHLVMKVLEMWWNIKDRLPHLIKVQLSSRGLIALC